MACILTPESPSSVTSWKDYFYSVRVKLFLVGVCFQLVSITTLLVVIRLEFDDPVMLGQFAALPLWIIGAVSARPATHATIAGAAVAVVVFGAFTFLATVT